MQIPSIPPPMITNTLPQDVAAKAVPNVQAAPPLIQRPVDPTPKSEKFNQTRSNGDRSKGGRGNPHQSADDAEDKGKDGEHSVNISV